ncbi:hypothetical protein HYFRA_00002056 [Hymenoscyphus fraxineus]|uniref:Uncharacterized protein n=1 Tax=Hymenoscyphus fraxineus TaxID=746836 RepID=A0A9N9KJU0_9HELO|nr:hypothetical protein HYFRA_00002056 [Hymenoscyphus fraxineus]
MLLHREHFLLGLAAIGGIPRTFCRALSSFETDVYSGNHAQAIPARSRDTQHKESLPFHTRDHEYLHNTRIVRRGKDLSTCKSDCSGEEEVQPKDLRSPEELTLRGIKALQLVASPVQSRDYTIRLDKYYYVTKLTLQESLEQGGLFKGLVEMEFFGKYGFPMEGGWQRVWIHSTRRLSNAVVDFSIATATKDGKYYAAIVTHARFATNDANRYQVDEKGENVMTEDGDFLPVQDGSDLARAIPVSQLLYYGIKETRYLKKIKPERFFLISEDIENHETRRDILAARSAMGVNEGESSAVRDATVLRKDAPGVEDEMFKLLCGNDNNYSWLNTVGRNPRMFGNYDIVSMTVRPSPFMMVIEMVKKPSR